MRKQVEIRTLIYAWEQFKDAAKEAEKLMEENGKAYVVFAGALKMFMAVTKPHDANPISGAPADEVILTFSNVLESVEDLYAKQHPATGELITAFDVWCEYSVDKLFD